MFPVDHNDILLTFVYIYAYNSYLASVHLLLMKVEA